MPTTTDTTVKIFHSAQTGAPVLSGTVGALISVLDACLVTGFGAKSIDSMTVSGGVATLTVTSGHSFVTDGVILVAGASVAALNGEQKVLSISGTTATFATTAADGTATGTITAKCAPLGWDKIFTATNLAAYRPADVSGTRFTLRVDDATQANEGRVTGYEVMTDISTGTGPFPSSGQMRWVKSSSSDSTARPWVLVGDGRGFYLCVDADARSAFHVYGFGDFRSYRSGDAYACSLSGQTAAGYSSTGWSEANLACSDRTNTGYVSIARAATGVGGAQSAHKVGSAHLSTVAVGYSGTANYSFNTSTYPNAVNNGLLVGDLLLYGGGGWRGEFVGLKHAMQSLGNAFTTFDKVDGNASFSGRRLMAVRTSSAISNPDTLGAVFFDLTGPWAR